MAEIYEQLPILFLSVLIVSVLAGLFVMRLNWVLGVLQWLGVL